LQGAIIGAGGLDGGGDDEASDNEAQPGAEDEYIPPDDGGRDKKVCDLRYIIPKLSHMMIDS
jgi:hypothetical protein